MQGGSLPIMLLLVCAVILACALLAMGAILSPRRASRVKRMPYESGMDPVHDTRRRFDIRFHLLAIAFLVFDVELLFLYPWAVVMGSKAAAVESPAGVAPATGPGSDVCATLPGAIVSPTSLPAAAFFGGMVFIGLLTLGFIYDWRKGIFRWR